MDQFVAEIRMFAGNFAPTGWALCNGQLMAISQNTALFSLLGTNYGGDGKSTFGLPNLMGRAPMHIGVGPDGFEYWQGQEGGSESVALLDSELPVHSHTLHAGGTAGTASPANAAWSKATALPHEPMYAPAGANEVAMGAAFSGASATPHNNMQPYVTVTYIIALQGIFPARP